MSTYTLSLFPLVLPPDLNVLSTCSSPNVSVEGLVLKELLALADGLVAREVGLLGCQKCVHPLVKERLMKQV